MIIGVGIDVVEIARFEQALTRTESLAARLFTDGERALPPHSLAARFAAKEALAKALGAPRGLLWTDAEVVTDDRGRPSLLVYGTVAAAAGGSGSPGGTCRSATTRASPPPSSSPRATARPASAGSRTAKHPACCLWPPRRGQTRRHA